MNWIRYQLPYCSKISLRQAPSINGVAVVSQVLCTSATLNKRKHYAVVIYKFNITHLRQTVKKISDYFCLKQRNRIRSPKHSAESDTDPCVLYFS
jgi:hypothetical protein